MREIHGTASERVAASPEAVFALITDVARLPEWNRAIERVVEPPGGELVPGAEWIVKMHPGRGMSWLSRSRVDEIDREALRFRYRTWNADGNPSFSDWAWTVAAVDGVDAQADVTVTWDVSLETLDRRLFAGPIRKRQLRKEVAGSLAAVDGAVRIA